MTTNEEMKQCAPSMRAELMAELQHKVRTLEEMVARLLFENERLRQGLDS